MTIATKAPKYKHYSASSSLSYRVSSAVLQKNEGYSYVSEVHESSGLSPGTETLKRSLKLNRKRDRKSTVSKTREGKKQRLLLQKKRSSKNSGMEVREGKTYESEIGLEHPDQEEIPEVMEIDKFDKEAITVAPLLVFDLETTGLSRSSDIIQLAACSKDSTFDTYILPSQPISKEATNITKITVRGNNMLYNSKPVNFKYPHQALTDFITFLSEFSCKPILVGHNIKRFDCHILYNALRFYNMYSEFCSHIIGFVDSLDVFKHVVPGLSSYSQTNLVDTLLDETYAAHNALEDTRLLFRLITCTSQGNVISDNITDFIFSSNYPHNCHMHQDNLTTFSEAINCKALSKATALKAARSNLRLCHLKLSIERNGLDGLRALLSELTNQGKVRVTSCKKIIQKMYDFLTPES